MLNYIKNIGVSHYSDGEPCISVGGGLFLCGLFSAAVIYDGILRPLLAG